MDFLRRIDAHLHFLAVRPQEIEMLRSLNVKLLNICAADRADWRDQQAAPYRQQAGQWPEQFAWCTTFDLPEVPYRGDYAERVIAGLEADFAAGAVACRVWKNIGMELRDTEGRYVQVDDPVFEPIFRYLEKAGRPVLAHLAEPIACWRPLDPELPHTEYYRQNPKWHLYDKPEFPSHRTILAARDRLLDRHPDLRLIGAHLGSLEFDLEMLADRMNRYPNFAVDTSGRLVDLAHLGVPVADFIETYRDRILWGSDLGTNPCHFPPGYRPPESCTLLRRVYELEWDYYGSDKLLTIGGRAARGLKLPAAIQDKIFLENARNWYPGLDRRNSNGSAWAHPSGRPAAALVGNTK